MRQSKEIIKQINEITKTLVSLGLSIDQNYPTCNKQRSTILISFSADSDTNIFLKNISYQDMYTELQSRKYFNLKMLDGALIQMQYKFRDGKRIEELESHRLAFFPSPDLVEFQNYSEAYINDEIYLDITDQRVVKVPIRFDYDNSTDSKGNSIAKPVVHPKSHLTLGQYKNCRIPVTAPITPSQFIEFILRNFYNTTFNKYHESLPKDSIRFEECIHEDERKIINICIPK